MWALQNHTPYQANRAFVRDRNGAEVWIVAVRGTFVIKTDGSTVLAKQQVPVVQAPEYTGKPGSSSLLYDTDLVLAKRTTDVLLHGHAYAPEGHPTTEVMVAIRVGPIQKILKVVGDRYWLKAAFWHQLSKPRPFIKMPITYERAYGGKDERSDDSQKHGFEPRNPVGTGYCMKKKHLVNQRAPNVLDMQKTSIPAGFGPIVSDWEPRSKYAGTYDEQWQKSRYPLLPLDFDERFYQCAPKDQQPPKQLRGGESVLLVNLSPEGRLQFRLPVVRLTFRTEFDGAFEEHRADLHTVLIEPDKKQIQMVWHTSLACHPKIYKLKRTIIIEKEVIRLSSLGSRSSNSKVG